MENVNEINRKIGKNLACYRKAVGLTQAELAEKINYSDKSVSKWESGNGVPDVYILMQIAELFGITVNDLLADDAEEKAEILTAAQPINRKKKIGLHILIMLLSCGIVWLTATCLFVGLWLWQPQGYAWLTFIYAIPVNAILMIVYAGVWKYRLVNFLSVSTLIWTALTALFLTFQAICITVGWAYGALWCLFLIGIPLQILEVLWVFFRTLFKRTEKKSQQENKSEQEE